MNPQDCCTLYLCDDNFSISAYSNSVNVVGWCEFVISNRFMHHEMGGNVLAKVGQTLTAISEKKQGKPLGLIKNSQYTHIFGGDTSEYLGYLVFSGYNTLYFFKESCGIEHIVLADWQGYLIVHQKLNTKTFKNWAKEYYLNFTRRG